MKKKLVVALISAAMVTSMLGACGSSNASSSSASNTSSANQGNIMDQRRANAQRNDYQRQGE